MKRSIDEVTGSDSVPPSALKRQTSEADVDGDVRYSNICNDLTCFYLCML